MLHCGIERSTFSFCDVMLVNDYFDDRKSYRILNILPVQFALYVPSSISTNHNLQEMIVL